MKDPDFISAPADSPERCELCGRRGAVYFIQEQGWFCPESDSRECARLGMELLMGPPESDPLDNAVLPDHYVLPDPWYTQGDQ